MKRIIYLLLILNLGLLSCVDDASVRVMPEFNCKDTKVNLAKAAGSSVTSLLYTNVGQGCCSISSGVAFCRCKR